MLVNANASNKRAIVNLTIFIEPMSVAVSVKMLIWPRNVIIHPTNTGIHHLVNAFVRKGWPVRPDFSLMKLLVRKSIRRSKRFDTD